MDGAGDSINLGAGDSFDFTPVFAADSLERIKLCLMFRAQERLCRWWSICI